jgi:DNA-binding response OmpR family regulator
MAFLNRERTCVLVAEDDPPLQKLLAAALRRRRIGTAEVSNGRDAIDLLLKQTWSVLLLDLMMPNTSGWEVINWIADHRDRAPSSVIVVTAADRAVIRELDPSVVNAIIFKPFDVFHLAAYIKSICDLGRVDRRKRRMVE